MDKEIPKEERRRAARKIWIKWGVGAVVVAACVAAISMMMEESVKESTLKIGKAESGTLESSVAASGKTAPLYEQAIVSPVATRILEVYCNEGDSVSPGESLLKLDLHSAEAEMRRLSDEVAMRGNELEQSSLSGTTSLTDLEMRIKVKEMAVSHLKAEVANEKRLDSIGSGTGDRIREAELAYRTGLLELDQLHTQLANERKSQAAVIRSRQLEKSISARNLEEMQRTLDDAQVKAPHAGIVTYLNKSLGTSISAGERLAVVSDLGHIKVTGEIAENHSNKISAGSTVYVRIGGNTFEGRVASIAPQSVNGVVEFTVLMQDDTDRRLRPGLRAEVNVVYDVKENVVRIPNGSYYQGAGDYTLFVRTDPGHLEARKVSLGDSNFDFVEVRSGIRAGEDVVITDMADYKQRKRLKLK